MAAFNNGRKRQPKGTPIGGQFAQQARQEPTIGLRPQVVGSVEVLRAKDPGTTPHELTVLASHADPAVRLAVASRADTPVDVLVTLSRDPVLEVELAATLSFGDAVGDDGGWVEGAFNHEFG